MAAETVAWWLLGGTREDWERPCQRGLETPFAWLCGQVYVWRRLVQGARHARHR